MPSDTGKILAIDVGSVRIGLALAGMGARLPSPAGTIVNNATALGLLHDLCSHEHVTQLVVGLPRGMSGQDTQQTGTVRAFGEKLAKDLALPLAWQDEAVTSVRAEEELRSRGKPYAKEDVDALAATYILEDYLREHV